MELPAIQIFPDLEVLSHHAASIFINLPESCITSHGRFTVAISGGSTPRRLYALLGSEQYRNSVDWNHVHFFWVDERCIPEENEESNFKLAFDLLLSKVHIPRENIHRIKGEESPEKAAREYEDDIKRFFGISGLPVFDLIILGMGEDGHTASLFPRSLSLKETERFAAPVYRERPEVNRTTLTLPVLNNASQILFLVSGKSKADMVQKILGEGHKKEPYPAGLIKPTHGKLLWFIDKEAASKLRITWYMMQDTRKRHEFLS